MDSFHAPPVNTWQFFFTEFARHNLDVPQPQPGMMSDKKAESFFHEFKQSYRSFCESGGTINVWNIAGIGTDEVRNCAVLGWLLDCHGSHGQGAAFLRCFLEAVVMEELNVACRERFPQAIYAHAPYRTIVENPYAQEGRDGVIRNSRVDIVIESESFLLFIEAKVRAVETGDQLKEYRGILRSRARRKKHGIVFLTVDGREPEDKSLVKEIALLSWKQLADSFETYIAEVALTDPSQKRSWTPLVQQFCQHIRTL